MGKTQNKAKILIYDLETAANISYTWGKWQQDVLEFEEEWYILCVGYKWLGEKTTHVIALPDFKGYKKNKTNDKLLVKELYKLFDQADIVVAHNNDGFDRKKSNTRFLVHGINPPSQYKSIDTLKVARKHFKFNSNKLDELGKVLGVGRKERTTGPLLWIDCMKGVPSAWTRMRKYNKQDVVLLEKIYYKLLPWIDNHPSLGLITDRPEACPKCGVEGKMTKHGFRITTTGRYQDYQCGNCGGRSHARTSVAERVEFVSS